MFVDNSNLFHAIRSQGNKKLDYVRLRDYLADGRSIDVRFYYSDPFEDDDTKYIDAGLNEKRASRDRFYRFLEERLQFEMIRLPLRMRSGYDAVALALVNHLRKELTDDEILKIVGQKSYWLHQIEGENKVPEEKGLDCEVVYDLAKLSTFGHYTNFILVAGDEDYARSLQKLRRETGIGVEVAFFSNVCSSILQREATAFIDLTNIQNLFKESYD